MLKKSFVLSIIGLVIYSIGATGLLLGASNSSHMVFFTIPALLFVAIGVLTTIKTAESTAQRNKELIIHGIIVVVGWLLGSIMVIAVVIYVFAIVFTKGAALAPLLRLMGAAADADDSSYDAGNQEEAYNYQSEQEYYDKDSGHTLQRNSDGSHVKINGEWVPVRDLDSDDYGVRDK